MTLIEAIKSGKLFRRATAKQWIRREGKPLDVSPDTWLRVEDGLICTTINGEELVFGADVDDLLAEDWEVEA